MTVHMYFYCLEQYYVRSVILSLQMGRIDYNFILLSLSLSDMEYHKTRKQYYVRFVILSL